MLTSFQTNSTYQPAGLQSKMPANNTEFTLQKKESGELLGIKRYKNITILYIHLPCLCLSSLNTTADMTHIDEQATMRQRHRVRT